MELPNGTKRITTAIGAVISLLIGVPPALRWHVTVISCVLIAGIAAVDFASALKGKK